MQPDLRCPVCGTPVPDTGVRSSYGIGPEPSGHWTQHGKCPSCHRLLERNPDSPEAPQLEQWRLPPALFSVGGTAVLRATGHPVASGGVVHELTIQDSIQLSDSAEPKTVYGSAHLSASGTLSAEGEVVKPNQVHVEGGVGRTEYEAMGLTVGMGLGSIVGKGGAVLGGAIGWLYAYRNYPHD
jgi:hypothetical protein